MYRSFNSRSVPEIARRGFTLIELLVVIAIIGILAGVLLSALTTARAKARDSRRAGQLHEVKVALELYFTAHGHYPSLFSSPPTARPCDPDPGCQLQSDVNWQNMINQLKADKDLAENSPEPMTWSDKIAQMIFPEVYAAAAMSIDAAYQDPLYPARHFEYTTSGPPQPANMNYRIRADFESTDNPLLKNSVTGNFYWTDFPTGPDACDQDPTRTGGHAYYCAGPIDDFSGFEPF